MKYIAYLVICLVLIGCLLYVIREPILLAIGNFLIVQDPLQPADVIHVIGGTRLSDRLRHSIIQTGLWKISVLYGWLVCCRFRKCHADRSTQLSIEQGIPADAIRGDSYPVTSTYQEAERLKLWIDQTQTPVHSVIIVSDPHRMPARPMGLQASAWGKCETDYGPCSI